MGLLHQLVELHLEHNQLRELPKEIGQLTQLEWLDLRANQLSQLPEEISHLPRLEKLDLRWHPQLVPGPKLETLRQRGCRVLL